MTDTNPRHADVPHHYTEEELHHLDVAHEEKDVNIRPILWFAVGLAVVAIVSAVIVWGLFRFFESQADARDAKVSPLAQPETVMPRHTTSPFFGDAPQPQLLTNEPAALRQFHLSEDQVLHGAGWVDEKAKIAHIPIEEAEKRLIERGLPARSGPAVAPWLGTNASAYGEASGGQKIPVGKQ